MMEKITNIIKILRESYPTIETIYKEGSCYYLYLLLKEIFPEAEPYYDQNHVITKIGENYYDITGRVEKGRHILMEQKYQQELRHYEQPKIIFTLPLEQLEGDVTLFDNGHLFFRKEDNITPLVHLTKKDFIKIIEMCTRALEKETDD